MLESADMRLENSDVLKNLEQHLMDLAEDTAQISKVVSDLIGGPSATLGNSAIRDLQKLDNLQQSLADAARLCAALAGPIELRRAAFSDLKLKATRTLTQKLPLEPCRSQGSVDIF